jgi:hypothetical protein
VIPSEGAVPPTAHQDTSYTDDALAPRAKSRDDASAIRRIKREHFGDVRDQAKREDGIAKLRSFRDPAAMVPMYKELRGEADDVVIATLDHFASLGEPGQAALAWIAINDEDPRLRNEATDRLHRPASPAVLGVLDHSLRSTVHMVANRAGSLAGSLNAIETIPLLIFAQATQDRIERKGDLAWIAIGTQLAYTANVVPVVGNNSGAFQPIVGVIGEGVVLRVTDAVVVSYRTDIHTSLVNMTTADWGQSTNQFGYDMRAWWAWYNDTYLPFKRQQAEEAERLAKAKDLERKATNDDE